MAAYYDICEQGDLLLQFSDRELGALVRALILYRGGSDPGPDSMPYNVRAVFAAERMRIDRAEEWKAQVSRVRQEAIRKRWRKQMNSNEYKCIEMNTNEEKQPPLSTPIADPPDISPYGENIHPRKGGESGRCPKKRFVKPAVEAVREYCESRQNNVDAGEFCDFYDSKGWLIGKTPMKDWRAAVRTWERSKKNAPEGFRKGGRVLPSMDKRPEFELTQRGLGGLKYGN
ncbi:MAG: hypothetical protein HPZ91_19200 [Lentisphaeria bacterium]|nr:hypothetical protein [Lentisphaeria bacterium]